MQTNYTTLFVVALYLFLNVLAISGQPPAPDGKKWVKVEAMSDEFNNNSLDSSKWATQDPNWKGRKPARFETSSVSVADGNLRVTASKKTNPYDGWTHNGAMVRSIKNQQYGYFEARMKANKTFMSSTFWIMTYGFGHIGCDDGRYQELDIQETVGKNSAGQSWINNYMGRINSNTHQDKTPPCPTQNLESRGDSAPLEGLAHERYYTYGCWWKSAAEVVFYVDGVEMYTIKPSVDFTLPMYLRMVLETYDWNPPKEGQDGMNDTFENRTTYYDWVHTYKLEDDSFTTTVDKVAFLNAPTTIASQTSYVFDISYTASEDREIVIEFWSQTNWLSEQKETVTAGSGVKSITVNLPNLPEEGTNYIFKAHIRPIGSGWQDALDNHQIDNVTVQTSLGIEQHQKNSFALYPNPTKGKITIELKGNSKSEVVVYDFFGKKVLEQLLNKNTIDLTGFSSGIYWIQFAKNDANYLRKIILLP